jgi:NADH:ubiquinone oxidoreductase subunit H
MSTRSWRSSGSRRSPSRDWTRVGLLILALVVPVVLTLVFAAPFFLSRSSRPAWQALVIGFILFNLVGIGFLGLLAYIGWPWMAGLVWFMLKSFLFVYVFVWMRATFPRVRIDQLMGFAWKWLLPAALLNLFVTAAAIIIVKS